MQNPLDRRKESLFTASCIALVVTSMTFAFRAALEQRWAIEYNLTNQQLGWVFSPAFWGFTLAMIFGGPLCDVIGMKRLIGLAFAGHISGIIIYMFATNAKMLFAGTVCIGIGNGMVEAACNPLIVSMYENNKTTMLNRFHVWFPGGIVIGGLTAYVLIERMNTNWHLMIALLFLPVLLYGFLFSKLKFPQTERVKKGISTTTMFRSCLKPFFILMILCMFLTASTELGTGTWIQALLQGANVSGILILVFINGIMAIGRSVAGPFVHQLNPNRMLIFSALFAGIGLVLLSQVSGYAAFGAALVFAIGVCFFWPTMLGFVSETMPETGALGLSLIGGAGMLSVSFILPVMGGWYDGVQKKAMGSGLNLVQANSLAGSSTFLKVALMPIIVFVVFILIYYFRKNKVTSSSNNS